jgi:succinate-acetate transporter protein
MNASLVLGITVVTILITLYEWPKINVKKKKEKNVFIVFIIIGWGLATLLIFFPDMKGPTDLLDFIYKPISKPLEKFLGE